MSTRFPGFPRQMPTFFRALEKNNEREWFVPRKAIFEKHVRDPMIALVTLINDQMRKISADHVADEPAKLLYRIYRDTRFSKDKTPYKTHIAATFPHRTLTRHSGAGFYFEISHKYVGIAGGTYIPAPDELKAIRTAIAADPRGFLAIAEDRRIRKRFGNMEGEKLSRLPKPWQDQTDSPVVSYLKHKQFYWWVELPPKTALSPQLPDILLRHFETLVPAMTWFNRVLLAARKDQAEDPSSSRPAPMW